MAGDGACFSLNLAVFLLGGRSSNALLRVAREPVDVRVDADGDVVVDVDAECAVADADADEVGDEAENDECGLADVKDVEGGHEVKDDEWALADAEAVDVGDEAEENERALADVEADEGEVADNDDVDGRVVGPVEAERARTTCALISATCRGIGRGLRQAFSGRSRPPNQIGKPSSLCTASPFFVGSSKRKWPTRVQTGRGARSMSSWNSPRSPQIDRIARLINSRISMLSASLS